jgi:hypothetical protein
MKLLRKENLFDREAVLSDNTGKSAERVSQIIFSQQGLPDGNGGFVKFKQVVSGQYNDKNGIDLLGISEDGTPYSIEIKKRNDPAKDSMGADSFDPKNLEPETLELIKDIERERNVNPVLMEKYLNQQKNDPDPELSTEQMSDLWLRDRWLKLIKNDEKRSQLAQAGVAASFLDVDGLKVRAYSDTWKKILDTRNTVIVSQNKDNVSSKLFREAVFKKKTNITVIDLGN